MPLARMETTVAINALLDRVPDLHLDPTAPEPVIKGVAFRSPAALRLSSHLLLCTGLHSSRNVGKSECR
jgi:cytochrome P450